MNAFLILTVAFGVVAADVSSLGYRYNVPQTSYGTPSHQISASSSNYNTRYTSAGSGGSGFGGQGVVSYPSGSVGTVYQTTGGYQSGGGSAGFGSGYQSVGGGSGYSGSAYQSSGSFGSGSFGGGSGSFGGGSGSFGSGSGGSAGSLNLGASLAHTFQAQSAQKYQQQIQFQSQPAQVFKHFYVHAAPEEPEVAKPRGPVVLPPAQKHYKIIFIKTPSPAGAGAQIAPVVPQTEEKTIVYVLVKKPEAQADLVVPKIDQKPPSKPEVYFIKYKNKDESQAVINNIVSDYNKGQQTVSVSGVGVGGAGGAGAGGFSGSSGSSGFSGFSGGSSSGFSGGSGSGFSGDSAGFSGLVGLSGGSGGAGLSVVTDSGSFGGQFDSGSAGSTIGSFESAGTGLSGGYSQGAGYSQESFSSGGGSLGGVSISKSEPLSQAVTSGYDSSDSGSVGLISGSVGSAGLSGAIGASSTASYDVTSLSSSQGVPHETYGIPTFKTL